MSSAGTTKEWPILEWWQVAERLAQQTFQVQRAQSCGTAFLCGQGIEPEAKFRHYIFATAWHVVSDLLEDDEFSLFRRIDGTAITGATDNIAIARLGPEAFDLGLLFIRTASDVLPRERMMPVRGLKSFPSLGDDLGWYGHPASLDHDPTFCRGSLACYKTDPVANCYLVSGATYPGVSGAGVADQRGWIIGVVSKWWTDPNLPNGQGMVQVAPSTMIRHVLEDRLGAKVLDVLPEGT
ncbi:MAG: trypsin-like peptidase domain-containing protein [Planctomycetes bacterium]|nr:trypsin-like peptidase domain-containing protein [Planctomycetota bacterium]